MSTESSRRSLLQSAAALAAAATVTAMAAEPNPLQLPPAAGAGRKRNILYVLVDDLRFDCFSFMKHPFVQTPNLDRLVRNGAHFPNAFVTTALCSPSRATVLTSLYAHQHKVVDNNNPVPPGTIFFPQYLQQAGYQTAFFGKWHMGGQGGNQPQPGFDQWVSFPGQGSYNPSNARWNMNGQPYQQKGYITDELTDLALDWLGKREADRPWFCYLAHKAVHAEFEPAPRHKDRYKDAKFVYPKTYADTPENYNGKPAWVKNQRNSWHGVDFPYHSTLDIAEYHKRYCETLLAVDESVGRIMDWLKERGQLDSTLIVFMGDNGFGFGEHGLIDKRTAYDYSMRVPLFMHCPELIKPGTTIPRLASALDIGPTFLAAAGLQAPPHFQGRSLLPLFAATPPTDWRDHVLYEYYWERNFPQTPTLHCIRTEKYKYIHYHGIWDVDELYDMEKDPDETTNLVFAPEHKQLIARLNKQLFDELKATQGMYIPLYPDSGGQQNLRHPDRSKPADFPKPLVRDPKTTPVHN